MNWVTEKISQGTEAAGNLISKVGSDHTSIKIEDGFLVVRGKGSLYNWSCTQTFLSEKGLGIRLQ